MSVCTVCVCIMFDVIDNISVELLTSSRSIASLMTHIDVRGQVFFFFFFFVIWPKLGGLAIIAQMGTDARQPEAL